MEFQAWPKTPRLFRDIVVTEKIDGTNSCIIFEPFEGDRPIDYVVPGENYAVGAQSRNRLIVPSDLSNDKSSDNYGFAKWVYGNRSELFGLLGPGRHYGEWWGKSIARNYDQHVRHFSLFNTDKWRKICEANDFGLNQGYALGVDSAMLGGVPVLYQGSFDESAISGSMADLMFNGSHASPGFMKPEGICVYHTQSKQVYKATLDNEDKGKWEVNE